MIALTKTALSEWRRVYASGLGPEAVPIIPVGATLTPGTTVKPQHVGKVPGVLTAAGTWSGLGGQWSKPDWSASVVDLKKWDGWGAGIGLQGRKYPGLDIDVDDPTLSAAIGSLAEDYLGLAHVRTRPGSAHRLMMYRTDEPLRKVRQEFGDRQAVELLCTGQQYVVSGGSPPCEWLNGHPFDHGPEGLVLITAADVEKFFAALRDLLVREGCTLGKMAATSASATTGTRKPLTDASLWAPSPEAVLALLKVWKPEEMAHDDFVRAGAAIKAAFGPRREEFFSDFLEWAPGARSEEYDETRKRWDSFTDAELGWDWLASYSGHGTDAAQTDFDDGGPAGAAADQHNTLEKMLSRYVWVEGPEKFCDLKTGLLLTANNFNSRNVGAAQFGRSGVQSAASIFQNEPRARKVAAVTYWPGKPKLVQEEINGVLQWAVNLYRPSSLVPTIGATDDDCRLWLDHVTLLFGPPGSAAREHVLDCLGFVLQHPGEKINHAIVLLGIQRAGKDTFLVPFLAALGSHNYSSVKPETLHGQFTPFLERQAVVVQEMMSFKEKREHYNKMKEWLAAPPDRVEVNRKFMQPYTVPNRHFWVFLTNHEDAIALEGGDRRFWVHDCEIEVPENAQYFARLYGWFEGGGNAACFGWLLARDVSRFDPCALPPMTKAKRAMLDTAQPAPVRWLRDQFSDGGPFAARTVMAASELAGAANDFSAPGGFNDKHAIAVLKLEGFWANPINRVRLPDGMRQLWVRDPSGLIGQLSPDKLRDRYIAEASVTKSTGAVA